MMKRILVPLDGSPLAERALAVAAKLATAADGVWAIGDVTGVLPLSHLAQYQAHLAADDILGHPHPARYLSVPRLYFTDPQIAATGLTLEQARERQIEVTSVTLDFERLGKLAFCADRRSGTLVGAWAMAPDAAELVQLAVLAINAAVPLNVLHDAVEQFPRFSEPYRIAFEQLSSQFANGSPQFTGYSGGLVAHHPDGFAL